MKYTADFPQPVRCTTRALLFSDEGPDRRPLVVSKPDGIARKGTRVCFSLGAQSDGIENGGRDGHAGQVSCGPAAGRSRISGTRAQVNRLDPSTGTLSPPLTPAGCGLADIAGDGTIACVEGYSGGVTLDLIIQDGMTHRQPLPGVLAAGSAHFSGHQHDLMFGGVATEAPQPVTVYILSGTLIRTVVTDVFSQPVLVDDSTVAVRETGSARTILVDLGTGARTTIWDDLSVVSVAR